ncbi:heptaprenyl diphosphate synthase [Cohnella sp. CFH 77786]|uniref:heptaprenyl diphosphate synthase component 1 n=1 Tax=Cohnella sp. CFH 77786 TaxID=2662265 RepID=UPI001C60837D|nr:heptaprenyl diphosphate synthase component 1 [Cohnella sp. CFH 77786]MBW5446642.1 heptaprenyl diphosphate synthase [Cohnella sp. CFH 77786]
MTRYRVEQLAHKYMNHDMISLHTELPGFPSGRVRLLHAVLSQQPSAASHRELLALVASLVQMGLDTHDMVENGPADAKNGMPAMRSRQLKVLAGDYFSSRFYHLLSQAGQIEAVRLLSEAICDLNRIKMNVYSKMKQLKLGAEEYVHYGAEIKSGLFLSFTGFMHGLYERLWPELVERYCRCEVLLQELRETEAAPGRGWGFWHVMQEGTEEDQRALRENRDDSSLIRHLMDKYGVAEKLGGLLRQSAVQLRELVGRFPSDKLVRELQPLIEPFLSAGGPKPAAALKELG